MGWPIDMEQKGCESIGCYTHFVTFNVHFTHDLDLGFSRSNFEKRCISGMGGQIDMERKRFESAECWIHVVTLNLNVYLFHDLDLGFSRSNFEKVVSQEWDGQLTWNERDVSRYNVRLALWLQTLTSPMTLTLDFYPRPVLAFGYCRCLRLSVSPSVTKFVRTITHYPFKLGSPNLDHRCKRPWLRSLLFCGTIDRDLQGQIELKSQNLPHFELVHAITHHQLKLQFPNLEQKCILALFRSLPILGLIEIDLQFNF